MKCPECGGVGRIHYGEEWCSACNGTGEVQTNEEWRKTCSAEEFAEALTKVVLNIVSWNNDPKPSEVRHILKSWLKQPHTIKE